MPPKANAGSRMLGLTPMSFRNVNIKLRVRYVLNNLIYALLEHDNMFISLSTYVNGSLNGE